MLANECFDSKAYYLASRYYQEVFDAKFDGCHPDQIKLAQSLAATQQLIAAESVFESYMSCQKNNPTDNITYGKFLMDVQAYEKAISYFEKGMSTEPELARHYMLVCQTALPKLSKLSSTVLINQKIPSSEVLEKNKNPQLVESYPAIEEKTPNIIMKSIPTVSTTLVEIDHTRVVNDIKVYNPIPEVTEITSNTLSRTIVEEELALVVVKKKISAYGVRLGSYKSSIIPNLSVIEDQGRIEQKQWNGKTIIFLMDFPSRETAEAAVKLARRENFRSATLIQKLASGRMKSIR